MPRRPLVTSVSVACLALAAAAVDAQVPAGPEFRVNAYTTGYQRNVDVASDPTGRFVLVWQSAGQDGGGDSIFGQRYDAAGAPLGGEFPVSSAAIFSQRRPAVAAHADGGFIAAWQSNAQDGSGEGIFGQRFAASGAPIGGEFAVNTFTDAGQSFPAVASTPDGGFVIAWNSNGQDGNSYGVFARRFAASGAPLGGELQVNTYTTSAQAMPAVATDASGDFVVAWQSVSQDGHFHGIFAQRYDAAGTPLGGEFPVNTYTTDFQSLPSLAADAAGNFVVAWQSYTQDGSGNSVQARRFDASGAARGAEFQVNTFTTSFQSSPVVASDASGNFVVAWQSLPQDGSGYGTFAQRYDAAGQPRGGEFLVNSYTASAQFFPAIAADPSGNFVVAWASLLQDGSGYGLFAQRFGGLLPAALAVDATPGAATNGNGVLEPDELDVEVRPSWRNVNGMMQTVAGVLSAMAGPAGAVHTITDSAANYGGIPDDDTAPCTDCYHVSVTAGTRPVLHWDASATETIVPDAHGQKKAWRLHVGDSFTDVPRAGIFYRFVETLLHNAVTGGCGAGLYCPASATTRREMAVFVLVAKEGGSYAPPACVSPPFPDVPTSSGFCPWIAEVGRRGVVAGCGGGNYCPTGAVARQEMAVFALATLDPTFTPPPCTVSPFPDVPTGSPFCPHIAELQRRGVVGGCGGGNYCPASPVTRQEMAVFISGTFGLTLYGI